jgi:hypothetical protein
MSEPYVPRFDELAPGEVSARIHSLDVPELEALIEHERHHGARPAILQVLECRLEAVRRGAPLGSGGDTST